ncbi:MAG: hypothetical protein WCK58_18735 [Chloroflexota bacterium]
MRIPKILVPTALVLASAIGMPAAVVVGSTAVASTAIVAAGSTGGHFAECPPRTACGMALNHCEPVLVAS